MQISNCMECGRSSPPALCKGQLSCSLVLEEMESRRSAAQQGGQALALESQPGHLASLQILGGCLRIKEQEHLLGVGDLEDCCTHWGLFKSLIWEVACCAL